MELEKLFTEQKWNILTSLSKGSYSPLQLAEQSKTTMANISQQLRLLEFSHIVKKEKVGNRDKGKPRTLFSLSDDYIYVIIASKGFAGKKLITVDSLHQVLLRTFFIEDKEAQYYLEKYIWSIEEHLTKIDSIVATTDKDSIHLVIAADNPKSLEKDIKGTTIKGSNKKTRTITVKIISTDEFSKQAKQNKGIFSSHHDILYDPHGYSQHNGGGI